ncbi:hypothetical protein HMPREF1868_00671 [Olsenella sp. DNF00959]|nr:hypothetical protein HMPREF1868_00671 [Olsenella sp. DNF00959]
MQARGTGGGEAAGLSRLFVFLAFSCRLSPAPALECAIVASPLPRLRECAI